MTSFSTASLVLLLACVLAPLAHAQSAICQSRHNTQETCEDGFTCAYSFTGADLYERFTFRVVESGNPNGGTTIIILIGGEGVTVREGTTEPGDAVGWTKRSSGEGESFYRVDNRNSSGDITTRFSCAQASTETTEPSDSNDDTIQVADMSPFAVMDSVIVAPNMPNEERRTVSAFGSLVLDRPLDFAHPAGTTVVSIGPGPAATAAEAVPGPAFVLRSTPNPASGTTQITLTLGSPEAVTVEVVDARGRRLALVHDGGLAAGPNVLSLDVSMLPAGAYVVRASGANGTASERLTVVR